MKSQLRLGAPLQIFNKQDRRFYTTGVKEVGINTFTIYPPECSQHRLCMSPQSWWLACLIGVDALYYFMAQVLEASQDPFPGYIICWPDSIYRRQRRKYVRVSCNLEVNYWIADGRLDCRAKESSLLLKEAKPSGPGHLAVAVDLSGGGLRMVTREFIPRQTKLVLDIYLEGEMEAQRLEGVVIRVVPVSYGSWKRYRLGVLFSTITSRSREKIIRYLFSLMRKRLKDCGP